MKIFGWMSVWREAYLWILIAGTLLLQTSPARATETFQDIRVQDANATRPRLIFGCDRQTKELESLFTPELISDLRELNAGIALSTEDFSPERAQVVRRLNAAFLQGSLQLGGWLPAIPRRVLGSVSLVPAWFRFSGHVRLSNRF